MKRDGANKSIWQDQMPVFLPAGSADINRVYDVAIVGGGITGVTTAYELQKAGLSCLLIEAKNLCFGTTGGTTAHLNNFFDKSYAEIKSDFGKDGARHIATAAKEALELYKKNISNLKIECDYEESEGILFAIDEKQAKELEELYAASTEVGIPVRYCDHIPINTSFVKAVALPGQGSLHPAKYVYALARAFEKAGGTIVDNSLVTEVEAADILRIHSSQGLFKSRKLIYATHIPPGVNLLHLRCAPYRSYVLGLELPEADYPANPCYDMGDPYHYYRIHDSGGKKYLIAGGEDHKTGHEENTELPFQRLEEYLRGIFKIKNIAFKWSSQYFETVDGLAYIGHLPGADKHIFVATGFGGNGMTYSHIAANYFRNLLIQQTILYDDILSPSRVKPVSGFSSFIKENADVAASLMTGLMTIHPKETPDSLANDSAEIIKFQHHTVALYKNEKGEVAAVNPVCPHLGCSVKWNQTEKSWDCPCHGARYSTNGEMLTGPSTKALKQIAIQSTADDQEHMTRIHL